MPHSVRTLYLLLVLLILSTGCSTPIGTLGVTLVYPIEDSELEMGQPVKFTVTRNQPGTYAIDIGGQKGSFTILGTSGVANTSINGGLIAILIVGILVIVVSTLLILDFRRSA